MQMPKVLARHLIQSFDIGEVTPEEAHEVGKQLADEWLKGKYLSLIHIYSTNTMFTSMELTKVLFVFAENFRKRCLMGFKDRLREKRVEANLTQAALAAVSYTHLTRPATTG